MSYNPNINGTTFPMRFVCKRFQCHIFLLQVMIPCHANGNRGKTEVSLGLSSTTRGSSLRIFDQISCPFTEILSSNVNPFPSGNYLRAACNHMTSEQAGLPFSRLVPCMVVGGSRHRMGGSEGGPRWNLETWQTRKTLRRTVPPPLRRRALAPNGLTTSPSLRASSRPSGW